MDTNDDKIGHCVSTSGQISKLTPRNTTSFIFENNNYFISWLNSNLCKKLLQLMLGRKLNGKIHTCNLFIFQLAYKKFLA